MRKLTDNEAGAGLNSVASGMGDSLSHESAVKHVTGEAQYSTIFWNQLTCYMLPPANQPLRMAALNR